MRNLFLRIDCSTATQPTHTMVVKISSRHIPRSIHLSNGLPTVKISLNSTRFGFRGLIPVVPQVQGIRTYIPRCRRGDVVSITYSVLRHDAELGEEIDDPHRFALTRPRGLLLNYTSTFMGRVCFLVGKLWG